ncbi:hypothetical protein BaRGS_00020088 [Batillaria attramentaria]|uniref:Uncharacterized protein n=1 Tax=Batillaria attramentaria TaxID=370345 RepID=A0ABD0KPB4_9CAEN
MKAYPPPIRLTINAARGTVHAYEVPVKKLLWRTSGTASMHSWGSARDLLGQPREGRGTMMETALFVAVAGELWPTTRS